MIEDGVVSRSGRLGVLGQVDCWHPEGGEQQYLDTWDAVLDKLVQWYPGDANVIVYPDLTMQYLEPDKA